MAEQQTYEDGDGMAVVCFRTNTIPSPIEFYPVAGMLSDGTIRAVAEGYYETL